MITKEKLKTALLEGNSYQKIADTHGVSRQRIGQLAAKYGMARGRRSGDNPIYCIRCHKLVTRHVKGKFHLFCFPETMYTEYTCVICGNKFQRRIKEVLWRRANSKYNYKEGYTPTCCSNNCRNINAVRAMHAARGLR
jgi:DNA-directed RNA polymerase subunit RPC12/RpoP